MRQKQPNIGGQKVGLRQELEFDEAVLCICTHKYHFKPWLFNV